MEHEAEAVSTPAEVLHVKDLHKATTDELRAQAHEAGIEDVSGLTRQELIIQILRERAVGDCRIYTEGVLEILPDGYGFLRSVDYSYLPSQEDIYVSQAQIKKHGLGTGHYVKGYIRKPRKRDKEKFFALMEVESIDGYPPAERSELPLFDDLTATHPNRRMLLEHDPEDLDTRIMDMITPVGLGQRALIVAAPRTGKTVLLKKVAQAVSANMKDVDLMMLLIDERPEEVTDLSRSIDGEVISSCFDEPASQHTRVTDMVLERCKRMVECGRDVVLLVDSLTRMSRAYNNTTGKSGKLLSGGIDPVALRKPKRFFGTARKILDGGSLTIIATVLVDTGSKMDQVIFEEFKGTGNMEMYLDRGLANRRIFPCFDILKSGTRKEELLLDPQELDLINLLRRGVSEMQPSEALENILLRAERSGSNAELLMTLKMEM